MGGVLTCLTKAYHILIPRGATDPYSQPSSKKPSLWNTNDTGEGFTNLHAYSREPAVILRAALMLVTVNSGRKGCCTVWSKIKHVLVSQWTVGWNTPCPANKSIPQIINVKVLAGFTYEITSILEIHYSLWCSNQHRVFNGECVPGHRTVCKLKCL